MTSPAGVGGQQRPRHVAPASRTRYVPLGSFALALALVVLALPTALRPPQPPPNTAAELSPDAPPDENQPSIVAALNRGTSGTAGAGAGEGAGERLGGPDPGVPLEPPPPVEAPRACPGGFGDPPRQVESAYSAPCAAPWQGDNGGATWKGVTEGEVRIGVATQRGGSSSMALDEDEGPVISDEPQEGESAGYRTWRVYQAYFNQNFQLYGRHLRFVVRTPNTSDPEEMRATVQELDEEYGVFGVHSNSTPALTEAARRGLAGLGGWNLVGSLYDDNQPYLTSWTMDGARLARLNAEYLCKKLADRTAGYAGAGVQGEPRKFGILVAQHPDYGANGGREIPALVKQQCGLDTLVQVYDYASDSGQQSVATAITQFRAAGVTTVAFATDALTIIPFLNQADSQGYFPEWFITGTWCTDWSLHPQLFSYSKTQWEHAFGLSSMPMARRPTQTDGYRAYRSMDSANTPAGSDCGSIFWNLLQIANGLQMAGPTLTPETFRVGLDDMGKRANDPYWTIGGGFGRGDHSYGDDVAVIWWDNTAPNPTLADSQGAYRYVDCGRRTALGGFTEEEVRVFDVGGTCLEPPPP